MWQWQGLGRPLLIWVALFSVSGFGFIFGVLGVCPSLHTPRFSFLLSFKASVTSSLVSFSSVQSRLYGLAEIQQKAKKQKGLVAKGKTGQSYYTCRTSGP